MATPTPFTRARVSTTPERGLTEPEARARHGQGRANALPAATSRTYREIVRENVFTFVNFVIFGLGLALLALGQWSDALVSVGVVTINIAVGLVQEVRAKQVLDRIAVLTRPRATVVRDGVERAVDPSEVVEGDILVLRLGDQVVVDGVLRSGRIDADESLLTGESDPVMRSVADRVLSGSFCVRGEGRYEAVEVGASAYANRVVAGARAPRRVRTPLQRQVDLVVRGLLFVAGSFAAIMVLSAIIEGLPTVEIVRRAVVVVGLVPNGLFVAIATAYALGAARMAGKGVLAQQTNAVESLSNVDVLCLDKTGTMTTGHLRVELVRPFRGDEASARALLGAVAASASGGGRTFAAIAAACPGERRPARDEVHFSSETRWSGIAFADEAGAVVVGAPEVVAERIASEPRARVLAAVADAAMGGLRVLLIARAEDDRFPRSGDRSALPADLTPVALVGLRDELRPGLRHALEGFAAHGVALKLISGDHPETVRALGVAAGLGGDVELGSAIAAFDDPSLERSASTHDLFARVGPMEKAKLVSALRAEGHYVAMLGDGVNDVPAMKRADLAIAINDGAQAARGVADLVLLKSSFEALPIAFREGQRVLAGMQNILRLFLTRIGYVSLLIAATALIDVGFPYTPKQSGLLSFFAVGAPALVLVIVARPVPRVRERLVASLLRFVVPAAWSLALVGLLVYVAYASATPAERAQSAVTLATILCGIALAMFAAPPSRFWAPRGEPVAGWLPGAFGLSLLAGVAWVLADAQRRTFFDLGALTASDVFVAVVISVAWTACMRWIWARDVFERALGIGPIAKDEPPEAVARRASSGASRGQEQRRQVARVS